MSKAGRKQKYETEDLKKILNEYVKANPNKKIKMSDLGKQSNIPYYVWRDNNEIQDLIKKLNDINSSIQIKKEDFKLPTAKDLVNKNYNNKTKLIADIQDLLEIVADAYSSKNDIDNMKELKENYENQITELEAILSLKDKEIERLSNEVDNLYLDSEDPLKRAEKGIKNNVIELSKDNIKKISKNITDIEEEYNGLFD